MNRILTIKNSTSGIGLLSRTSTEGAESDLVAEFIEFYCSRFQRYQKNQNLALFIEPRLESGFPDIVFAHYTPAFMDSWNDVRNDLDIGDLKVLSFLIQTRGANGKDIVTKLGLPETQALHSLEKLLDSQWIARSGRSWKPSGMRSHFGLKQLVAVEAKIGDIGKVSAQAVANTWFASHSYALTGTSVPRQSTLDALSNLGLGLFCKGQGFRKALGAKVRSLPSSYASLLFNEWVAKTIMREMAV